MATYKSSYTGPQIDQAVGNALNKDTSTLSNDVNHIPASSVVKSAIDALITSGTGYVKLPGGIAISWGVETIQAAANAQTDQNISYSFQSFNAPPVVVANVVGSLTPINEITGPNIKQIKAGYFTARVLSAYSQALSVDISYIAIGTWN